MTRHTSLELTGSQLGQELRADWFNQLLPDRGRELKSLCPCSFWYLEQRRSFCKFCSSLPSYPKCKAAPNAFLAFRIHSFYQQETCFFILSPWINYLWPSLVQVSNPYPPQAIPTATLLGQHSRDPPTPQFKRGEAGTAWLAGSPSPVGSWRFLPADKGNGAVTSVYPMFWDHFMWE